MLVLVEPAIEYKDALLDAVRDFHMAGEYEITAEELETKFDALILRLQQARNPATAAPGDLPYEDFWMMDGAKWIGKLTLRTTINEKYLHAGGHIGYEIRPSSRRCGYGTALLRLGLEKARERGLSRVLLTCDETNIGSRKIIESNGGRLENSVAVKGQDVRKMRYWIKLQESASQSFPPSEVLLRTIHKGRNMETQNSDQLLEMLKALADESRIALLRILNEGEQTVGDLARMVELGEPTVSHHLTKLRETGLVTLRMAGNQRFYRVNPGGLARFKKLAAEVEQMPPKPEVVVNDTGWVNALGWPEEEAQVLREYIVNGKLTRIPGKLKKANVIVKWLATLFRPGPVYSEADVNTIIKSVYAADYVSLRRDLIEGGYLRREPGGGKYWVDPAAPVPAHEG